MENKRINKFKLNTKESLDSPAYDRKNASNDINNNNSSTKENNYEYYYEEGVKLLVEAARRYRALREASLIDTNISSSPLSASLLVRTKVKSPLKNSNNTRKKRRNSSTSVGSEETELSLENSLTQSHSTETKNEKAQRSCNEELKNNEVEESNVITRSTEKITTRTEPTKSNESSIIAGGTNSLLCKQHASVILGLLDFYQ